MWLHVGIVLILDIRHIRCRLVNQVKYHLCLMQYSQVEVALNISKKKQNSMVIFFFFFVVILPPFFHNCSIQALLRCVISICLSRKKLNVFKRVENTEKRSQQICHIFSSHPVEKQSIIRIVPAHSRRHALCLLYRCFFFQSSFGAC